jgi:hypothetical protein
MIKFLLHSFKARKYVNLRLFLKNKGYKISGYEYSFHKFHKIIKIYIFQYFEPKILMDKKTQLVIVTNNKKMNSEIWYFVKDSFTHKFTCPACPFYYKKTKGRWNKFGEHFPSYHALTQNKLRLLLFKVSPASNKHLIDILSEERKCEFYGKTEDEARKMIHYASVHVWIMDEEDKNYFRDIYFKFKDYQRISKSIRVNKP